MNQALEQKVAAIEKTLAEVLQVVRVTHSLAAAKQGMDGWVSKEILMVLTGFSSKSVNTYVSSGKILKRGNLYSYRSYLEYLEIYPKRKPKSDLKEIIVNDLKHSAAALRRALNENLS